MNRLLVVFFCLSSASACFSPGSNPNDDREKALSEPQEVTAYDGTGEITQGPAKVIIESLFSCVRKNGRIAGVGEIAGSQGKSWTVPASNHFTEGIKAHDLYNECNGITPRDLTQVDLTTVPIAEIDSDGEVITGYIFADNYFELYVNGQLLVVDPVPFTPFNSNVVRFKVNRPYTVAMKLIDWEENLGLGTEKNRGKAHHAGDGGLIASFSDGTVTSEEWKAQTFYTAPVKHLTCLEEVGQKRLSANCSTESVDDATSSYGVHWSIPDDVFGAEFDDSNWPNATTYTEEVIGVDNKPAYMNFIEKFSGSGAEFIWSTNVILDNTVIVRYTIR